jgi:hypothetical protein
VKELWIGLITNEGGEPTAPSYGRVRLDGVRFLAQPNPQCGCLSFVLDETLTFPSPKEDWGTVHTAAVFDAERGGRRLHSIELTGRTNCSALSPAPCLIRTSLNFHLED